MENSDINDAGLIRIERAFYEHKQLRKDFDYQRPKKPSKYPNLFLYKNKWVFFSTTCKSFCNVLIV